VIVARLCAAAIGVCLMAAPASIDANPAQATSMHITGPIVVALSLAAAAPALDRLRWLLIPAGGWLIVAPWILRADRAGVATGVVAGALLIMLACPARRQAPRRGGGWRALTPLLRAPSRAREAHDG
jgi:hypothetical protein